MRDQSIPASAEAVRRSVLAFVLLAFAFSAHAITISQWTFETSSPTTSGPISPEVGSGSATGVGLGTVTSPAGNGSAHSFSANGWAAGDYWQFQVNTIGFQNISISWDQAGSSTGPRDFILKYSTDGTLFTQLGSAYQVSLSDWSATTFHSGFTFTPDLSAIAATIANKASIYFQLVDNSGTAIGGAAVAAAGTDRIDNFTVSGNAVSASVPEALPLSFSAAVFLVLLAASRRFVLQPAHRAARQRSGCRAF
jgi:hypothetical protein